MTQIVKNKPSSALPPVTQLLGNHRAPTAFYQIIEQEVKDGMPVVMAGKLYKLKMLCGEVFWQILGTNFSRRLAGRCFAHMVTQGRFPFVFIQYKNSKTKHYILR